MGSGARAGAESARRVLQALARDGARLHIAQDDSIVAVTYADSSQLRFRVNGKKTRLIWMGIGDIETKASWRDGVLGIERKLEGGIKIYEVMSRAPGSNRLIVLTTIEGGILPERRFRRVYDPG
jgi:hypothetical protein